MIVRHFDLQPPKTQPPEEEGWMPARQGFYGYHTMTKCVSQQVKTEWEERDRAERAMGLLPEGEFQQDCFLSVLSDIKREHVNLFEVGTGNLHRLIPKRDIKIPLYTLAVTMGFNYTSVKICDCQRWQGCLPIRKYWSPA